MSKILKILAALGLWASPAPAQTYTQMQWGMDKTVSPYAFGANVDGTWRNLGTVTSGGVWSIPSTNISGLGTAATQNIGTSGANVPLLSTANTWGGAQNFSAGATVPFTQSGSGAVATNVDAKLKEALSVKDYGAVGNGVANDTTAFTNCLTYAATLGKVCSVPAGKYLLTSITIPNNSGLVGEGRKIGGVNGLPNAVNVGPTLMTTNTVDPLIRMQGGTILSGFTFYYPNQVAPTFPSPVVYPTTIRVEEGSNGGVTIDHLQAINAYDFLTINMGRVFVDNLLIGALHDGIVVDNAQDFVYINNTMHQVMWDIAAGATVPSTLDAWVMTNSTALTVGRADSLHLTNMGVFGRFQCALFTDSSNVALSPRNSYGDIDGLDCDSVSYGPVFTSTNNTVHGWKIENVTIGPNLWGGVGVAGQTGIYLTTGGTAAPIVTANHVDIRGSWASGFYAISAGNLRLDTGYGVNGQGALTAPAIPATNVAQTNNFPFPVRVFVTGGTVSAIKIGATNTGAIAGQFTLNPAETITLTYTVAPTWTWFGL